jgi:ABC-type cobalamin/Fe3+-siderophores transport system ATPase subunit
MTSNGNKKLELFKYGSVWVRTDFHLHTKADKEFSYAGDENSFVSSYVEGLKKAAIGVGVISNHNKFESGEFKALRKKALKDEIFLLPGVELSVSDGSNGIHTVIVFSDDWIADGNDYINQFLNVTFTGKTPIEYENANGRSNDSLIETIKKLETYHKDFFLVFAHVEDKSGLWTELDGGRIQELGGNEFFRRRSLGFQKVRTHDLRVKVKNWLVNSYPAEVEGSDCKEIDQIGKGQTCYLKIGDFTFEAVKYALLDQQNRLSYELKQYKHSRIQSISFEGGVLDGQILNFSPELNCLIGIRGSGKSSIVEAIRYVLDIPFGEKVVDDAYKNQLVRHTFASGGKAVIKAVDRHGQEYEIRRILNDYPDVYVDDSNQPGVKIRETILHKPIYFGQKDLSSTGEGFEKDLVEKLVGEKLVDIRRKIETQRQRVSEVVDNLKKLASVDEQKKEYEGKKLDAEYRLKIFKEHGVEEKLQKQIDFDSDSRKLQQIIGFVQGYLSDLNDFISRFEDDFSNLKIYKSKQNTNFFDVFFAIYDKSINAFQAQKQGLETGKISFAELKAKANDFDELKKGLKEEFAEIERKLAEDLKESGVQSIRPDDFLKLRKTVDQAKQMLDLLDKQQAQKSSARLQLVKELSSLNDLWHAEFKAIQEELDKINQNQPALTITAEYKGDKDSFAIIMKEMFKGSRIRENTFQTLADKFADFGTMYRDFEKVKAEVSSSIEVFERYFTDNLKTLLTWQVPNKFVIKYRDKELKHHSLGQRASALILFVLSQRDNDLIIIDQPEDDLDNQTIYADVITLIRKMKFETQFIFATHNANFPVLGDAELVHSCHYSDEMIVLESGSIDNPSTQKEIVEIMEGGEEAFNRRKEIYQIWNPQNSLK